MLNFGLAVESHFNLSLVGIGTIRFVLALMGFGLVGFDFWFIVLSRFVPPPFIRVRLRFDTEIC